MSNKHNYFIPGGLLLGLGIGLAINRAGPGLFIGLGIGFILTAFVPKVKVKKSEKRWFEYYSIEAENLKKL